MNDFLAHPIAIMLLLGSLVPAVGTAATLDEQDEAMRQFLEARTLVRSGRNSEGMEKLESVLSLAEQSGQHLTAALVLANMAEIYRLSGDTTKAVSYYRQALEKYRLIGHHSGIQATREKIDELVEPDGAEVFAAEREELINQAIERVRRRVKAREGSWHPSAEAEYATYLESVKETILSSWSSPEIAIRNSREGSIEVEFTILQDGRLADLRVVHPSEHPSMDIAAIAAVKAAAPFPKIPEQLDMERLNVALTFNYVLE